MQPLAKAAVPFLALLGLGCLGYRVEAEQARPYLSPVLGEPRAFLLHTRVPLDAERAPQALELRREGEVLVVQLRMKPVRPEVDPRSGADGALYAFTIDAGVQSIAYGDARHLLWTRSGGCLPAPIGALPKTAPLPPKTPVLQENFKF